MVSGTPSNLAITITGNKVANSLRISTLSLLRSSKSLCERANISGCKVFIFRVVNARKTRPLNLVCFGGSSSSIEFFSKLLKSIKCFSLSFD